MNNNNSIEPTRKIIYSGIGEITSSLGLYVVDENGEIRPEPDLYKWGVWMETASRRVFYDIIRPVEVFTSFLGVDHNFSGISGQDPILFETMVSIPEDAYAFDKRWIENFQRRYRTKEEALAGHLETVQRIKSLQSKEKTDDGAKK